MADELPQAIPTLKRGIRRAGDTQKFVASFVLATFLGVVILICWHTVPAENKDALEILIGVVAGSYKDICQYFFGSTSQSHQKDDAIQAMATTTANVTGTPTP